MTICLVCKKDSLVERLDLGLQPVSNRFLASPTESEFLHPLGLSICEACGLVQLYNAVPSDEVRPRVDWITYNEPEVHLSSFVDRIAQLPKLPENSLVLGVSRYDEPMLRRLQSAFSMRGGILAPLEDLGITAPGAGIETLQQQLTSFPATSLTEKYGRIDMVVARYVLEHAHDPVELLANLMRIAAPGGYVVVEVPDASQSLHKGDYSTLWEEHTCYFTPTTLRGCLHAAGLNPIFIQTFADSALLAVCRRPKASCSLVSSSTSEVADEIERAHRFLRGFRPRMKAEQAFFAEESRQGGIALLGAGHATCAFVNLFQLGEFIDLIIDDNPKKQGLFMPGSRLPIRSTEALRSEQIRLCLMNVRTEVEDAVLSRNQAFVDRGGEIASLCADSRYSRRVA